MSAPMNALGTARIMRAGRRIESPTAEVVMSPLRIRRRISKFHWRVLPVGLWLFALACDLAFLANRDPFWQALAFYGLSGGLALGLAIGLVGFVAWLRITDPHWRAIGAAYMTAYLMVALLLGLSLMLRSVTPVAQPVLAVILSGVAIALFLSSTWIEDELAQVYRQRHDVSWIG
ncbi:MAG TPA: DUF2231 domain-containing protein [Burkholderiales bacterium]|nr:DUF2231 domain-containing protein [Burkholderiales bacterium]